MVGRPLIFETSFNRVVLQVSTNMGKEKQDIEQCKDLLWDGVDLLCFDKINIADPEVYGATYPLTRSVVAGLTIGF